MKSLLRLKPYIQPYLWLIVVSGILAIPLAALRLSPAPLVSLSRLRVSLPRRVLRLFE